MPRIVVLTTDTLHHVFFVRELARAFPLVRVFVETRALAAPFEVRHPFEEEREACERRLWFGGAGASLDDVAEVEKHESMNDPAARAAVAALRPDIVVVFGTGKLSPEIIDVCPDGIVNLHGGDPEAYRGLDTHLWAIYHGDFGGLSTTLHKLAVELDRGEIIAALPLPIAPRMKLSELRAANTEVCLRLVTGAVASFASRGSFVSRPQRGVGRYYSFMPAVLKELCVRRFEGYTKKIP